MIETKQFRSFYNEVYNTIWKTVSSRMNVVPGNQNKSYVTGLLSAKGWNDKQISELEEILDRCAWNLYVPEPENTDSYTEIYQRTKQILERLEMVS